MAPIRNVAMMRRRSSLSMMGKRRRSLVPPKNITFAPNVTPVTYPSDPNSPTRSPNPDGSENDAAGANGEMSPITPTPSAPRRRRNGRRDSVEHIPRPPNAFMLFRQNFVHQRHVPGSIETNHHSLSKIVGNCWKALPASDKKQWEELAEKKKEEHKRMYPDYRFQPKHDPEKKRKRQAAKLAAEKAERERLQKLHREQHGIAEEPVDGRTEFDEKDQAMAARRAQVRTMHNHLGHRRSSSVPLPTETYGYPYNSYGVAPYADPFNFANPAIANGPHPATSAGAATSGNGIAIPSLPTMNQSWYPPQSANMGETAMGRRRSNSMGALGAAMHAPQPLTLSRGQSPRVSFSGLNGLLGSFNQVTNSMGGANMVGMNTFGMGTRAARQHQLGQLGRRASSTQPILQHQFASGAFANFGFGAPSSFPQPGAPFSFGAVQQSHEESLTGPDGFVGAVAEGFTNPFAQTSAAPVETGNSANTQQPLNQGFPAPLAPNAIWYEVDSVDPMTPVGAGANEGSPSAYQQSHPATNVQQQQQHAMSALPEVGTALLNPAFNFSASGDTANENIPPPPSSASVVQNEVPTALHTSAPQAALTTSYGNGIFGHHHAPHLSTNTSATGARDSFDFSAFNAIFSEQTQQQQQNQQQQQQHPLAHVDNAHIYTPTTTEIPPHAAAFAIAQPVPVRKVMLPDVPENGAVHHTASTVISGQAHSSTSGYYPSHSTSAYQQSQPSSESSASGSPASATVAIEQQQQQQQQQYHANTDYVHQQQQGQHVHNPEDIVTGLELLEGPVDVQYPTASYAAHEQTNVNVDAMGYPQQVQHQQQHSQHSVQQHAGYGTELGYGMPQNLDAYGTSYGSYGAEASQLSQGSQDTPTNGNAAMGGNVEPRFSFSDYMHGSPFANSAAVVN